MNITNMRLKGCFLLAILLGPALADAADAKAGATTYTIVRHAEKTTPAEAGALFDAKDPSLSAVGQTHAAALATALHDVPLYAVYATPFKRTQSTAEPSARQHGLQVKTYAPDLSVATFVAQLTASAKPGAVLVVAHSNTVPEIVSALCHCPAPSLAEADFGHRFDVRIDKNGKATLSHLRY